MKKYGRFMRAAAVLFAAALIAAGCGQSSGSAGYDYKEEAMAEESAPTSAPSYGGTADYPAYSSTADEDYEAVSESAAADTYDAAGSAKNESGSTEPDTASSAIL